MTKLSKKGALKISSRSLKLTNTWRLQEKFNLGAINHLQTLCTNTVNFKVIFKQTRNSIYQPFKKFKACFRDLFYVSAAVVSMTSFPNNVEAPTQPFNALNAFIIYTLVVAFFRLVKIYATKCGNVKTTPFRLCPRINTVEAALFYLFM